MSGFGPAGRWASCVDQLQAIADEQQRMHDGLWGDPKDRGHEEVLDVLIGLLTCNDPEDYLRELIADRLDRLASFGT